MKGAPPRAITAAMSDDEGEFQDFNEPDNYDKDDDVNLEEELAEAERMREARGNGPVAEDDADKANEREDGQGLGADMAIVEMREEDAGFNVEDEFMAEVSQSAAPVQDASDRMPNAERVTRPWLTKYEVRRKRGERRGEESEGGSDEQDRERKSLGRGRRRLQWGRHRWWSVWTRPIPSG